ncbi:MarR family winged helix-turn-helix transcriptional regulator [Rhodococcus jostii]|uniref:DNA-binding transcriptional regulator, MarR family n=1 Tax=Rhodococcus jostii TaxID=132919 RepID=A0A1H4IR96_RHOJO|nr:MarR family winged helix-turn-helix transcriptional regulator [Rhodococcus jostii]SEB35742.1 DNA-binding transcriptional regulator, MarR family [Rhodococcus jostii]
MATRWLDERESRAWRGLRRMHADLSAHLARQLTEEFGLTEADYVVLVEVSEAPGRRIRSRDLGRALGWERSRLSHQIARMEARGSVRRARCDTDARGFDVLLTDEGVAAIEAAAPLHLAGVRHCFVDLLTPEQLDVLADIADTVTDHLDTEHLGSAG